MEGEEPIKLDERDLARCGPLFSELNMNLWPIRIMFGAAGSPWVWEARLRTADDLEAEARRIAPRDERQILTSH
jgi:hypothetical protein